MSAEGTHLSAMLDGVVLLTPRGLPITPSPSKPAFSCPSLIAARQAASFLAFKVQLIFRERSGILIET
jgi:hypothetical protein